MTHNQRDYFETLLNGYRTLPANKRLIWIRGFSDALHVMGHINAELRKRVQDAEEEAFDAIFAEMENRNEET